LPEPVSTVAERLPPDDSSTPRTANESTEINMNVFLIFDICASLIKMVKMHKPTDFNTFEQ
jgi:hypothetical protein